MNQFSDSKPNNSLTAVRIWLYILAMLIVVMVLVGGATRLTDSGLSITEWAPIRGFLPPLSASHWLSEFAAYQTTDEFKYQNHAMTLEQFKAIYWWEWGHRFLGRIIGLAILLPMIWFWLSGKLEGPQGGRLKIALVFIFILICLQGALGWWMVKSGLVDRVDVSQIRLAVHLLAACLLLVSVVWVARSLAPHSQGPSTTGFGQAVFLIFLILLQIFVGGLVAGLDAGMAYNTWPKMNGAWLPDGLWAASPVWINLTDNALTVQFFHRISAYALWICSLGHAIFMLQTQPQTTHARRAVMLLVLITLQAMIGIITLVLKVPMSWALLHQAGGVLVLIFATSHLRALRPNNQTASGQPFAVIERPDVAI